jgi:excisionase family DNA binding protein
MESNNVTGGYQTAEEVGAHLRLNADTVLGWARQGRIPFVRLSRKIVRFKLADVVAALEASQNVATAEEREEQTE